MVNSDFSLQTAVFWFQSEIWWAFFINRYTIVTMDALRETKFNLKMKVYKFILKVKRFPLPNTYHFSTMEGKPSLIKGRLSPPPLFWVWDIVRLFCWVYVNDIVLLEKAQWVITQTVMNQERFDLNWFLTIQKTILYSLRPQKNRIKL